MFLPFFGGWLAVVVQSSPMLEVTPTRRSLVTAIKD